MKKRNTIVLFLSFTLSLLSFSCTSESTAIYLDPEATSYRIRLNINKNYPKSSQEKLNSGNKKDTEIIPEGNYLHYIVYKKTGEVITEKILPGKVDEIETIELEEELKEGTYHFAIIEAIGKPDKEPIIYPKNFYTDYAEGNKWESYPYDNTDIFFDSFTYTLPHKQIPNDKAEELDIPVNLEAMWSEFQVTIIDRDIWHFIPETTTILKLEIEPYTYGFSISDKKPSRQFPSSPKDLENSPEGSVIDIDNFYGGNKTFRYNLAETDKVNIYLACYWTFPADGYAELLQRTLIYEGKIEQGKLYNIESSLDSKGI